MNFILSTILSGFLYDMIKESCKITLNMVSDVFSYETFDSSIDIDYINKRVELAQNSPANLAIDSEVNEILSRHITYNTNFAERLDYVIALMRFGGRQTSVDELGEYLGYNSVNELKKHYITQEEPDYQKIEYIADKLGVNKQWLKNGSRNVFQTELANYIYLPNNDVNEEMESFNPNAIYFVLSNERYPYIGIVMKIDNIKSVYYSHTYPFSSQVGGTGQSEIYTLYSLMQQLFGSRLSGNCFVRAIPRELFDNIFSGKVYSGIVEDFKYRKYLDKHLDGYWIEDFLHLNLDYRNKYLEYYGEAFVECQDIVRYIESAK